MTEFIKASCSTAEIIVDIPQLTSEELYEGHIFPCNACHCGCPFALIKLLALQETSEYVQIFIAPYQKNQS